MGGSAWNCPFPAEADGDGVDNAVVTIRVDVSSAGTVRNVIVLSDPGHGFAREARRCASSKKWSPTLDHDGTPIQGTVTLRVRFDR
jgi:protein TonB